MAKSAKGAKMAMLRLHACTFRGLATFRQVPDPRTRPGLAGLHPEAFFRPSQGALGYVGRTGLALDGVGLDWSGA